jgi:hypothetical protein
LPRYTLNVLFDDAAHSLSVQQTIDFTNPASGELGALPDLALVVEPNRWPNGFELQELAWGDGAIAGAGQAITEYTLEGNRLRLPLAEPLLPGESLQLQLSYQVNLPPIPPPSETNRPVPYGYTDRQTNLVDWHPFLPPYQPDSGWQINDPWYFGEHQVYAAADFQVDLTLADPQAGLVIAASAPAEQTTGGFRYTLRGARSFALSASTQYEVFQTQTGETTILSYAFPAHSGQGQAALQYTAEALELYQELFGPYPFASLSVVEADFLDGMEYSGLYFLSRGFYNLYDGTPQGYLTIIAAHETAHQWWHSQVGNDQGLEPWLDEALCTYSERLFYEHQYPELVDWWWAFRIDFYQPGGAINGSIYDYDSFRAYRDAVYLHGAQFLEALRAKVGDEMFRDFLRAYAAHYRGQQATAQGFFDLLHTFTAENFDPVIEAYFK